MISQENVLIIKDTIREFFNKTSFEVEIEVREPINETLQIDVNTSSPQILIGEGGQNLAEMQYLLKMILNKKIKESFYIDLDINGYKKKKSEYLKELIDLTSDEVALTKQEKTLAPMSAYERRIVHMEISKREDVVSESIGEGEERRVIIKPK